MHAQAQVEADEVPRFATNEIRRLGGNVIPYRYFVYIQSCKGYSHPPPVPGTVQSRQLLHTGN